MGAMTPAPHEVHVEHLLGRKVRDAQGKVVGRIEELCVEIRDGEPVVVEIHAGPAALLERIGAFVHQLPFFSLIPRKAQLRRIPWNEIDLRDEWRPCLRGSSARR
jgi:sporulation protein YlmC with PRC-barrel domain